MIILVITILLLLILSYKKGIKLDNKKRLLLFLISLVIMVMAILFIYIHITSKIEQNHSNCDNEIKDNVSSYDYYIKYYFDGFVYYNIYKIGETIKVNVYSQPMCNVEFCCPPIFDKTYDLNFTEEHMNTIYEFFNNLFVNKEVKIINISNDNEELNDFQINVLKSIITNNESLLE